ncbi:MAG: histidine kinase [Bacteroidota bacterium]
MLPRLTNFLLHRVTRNVIFWLLFVGLPIWFNWGNYGSRANFLTDIFYYLELAFLGYFNNLVLIPRLMDKGRVVIYFTILFFLVPFVAYLSLFWFTPLVSDYTANLSRPWMRWLFNLADFYFFVGSFTGAALLTRLAQSKQRSAQLSEQQRASELNFLKAQINPHLLFNTLNMFYGAAQERSPALPEMMMGLANSMRYALHEGRRERVELEREITFLKDYTALQELRLEGRATINFTVDTGKQRLLVPPMLFIVLVENAFKYATDHHVEGIIIHLRLEVWEDRLRFRTENNVGDHLAGTAAGGIGLENLRNRLKLIYGKDLARLRTDIVVDKFVAELSLPLELAPFAPAASPKKQLLPS